MRLLPRYQLAAPQPHPFAYGCAVEQMNCAGMRVFAISKILLDFEFTLSLKYM